MFAARAYRLPADEDTDTQQPFADLVPIAQTDRMPADHPRSDVMPAMGPPNRAPGVGVMGSPDPSPGVDVMGKADHGLGLDVMGGPDRGPRLDVMGKTDPRFVDFLFTGRTGTRDY
jgi:hypothetical protein